MPKIILPDAVKMIIDRLESAGYRADAVGGAVRDSLLSRVPGDYDVTTAAPPSEMERIFSDHRVIKTGIKHGTLTVLVDSVPYEVTTYRIDGEYTDMRHPDSVSFSDRIEDDLARRDFTVNSIAYSDRHGLTDPYGGREDLECRIIRAVGDPVRRFSEDALRILRAIRFSSVLDFDIEENTKRAILSLSSRLSFVAFERIFVEWKKLLSGPRAYSVILEYLPVINVFLPEITNVSDIDRELFDGASPDERELMLFSQGTGAPSERYKSGMTRLKSDKNRLNLGVKTLLCMDSPSECEEDVRRMLYSFGGEVTLHALRTKSRLKRCDGALINIASDLVSFGYAITLAELDIGGEDLVSLGYRGKEIGECLEKLRLLVILGKLENKREALLKMALREKESTKEI